MAGINGNVSSICMQGCKQAASCWLLAASQASRQGSSSSEKGLIGERRCFFRES